MLHGNCSYDAIKGIKFGFGFIANQRTFKLRYTNIMAFDVMNLIPKHFHRDICVYRSKTHTFLAVIAHPNSAIWAALESARISAKAASLRREADALEFGVPAQITLSDELPF